MSVSAPDPIRALGAPRSRELLRLLRAGERSAGDLHRELPDVTFVAVSQHLRVLRQAGLVAVRAEGRGRFYRVVPHAIAPHRRWLAAAWDDALYVLKLAAELEEGRRGPRARARRRRRP
jgi:DNA-binding transcriptional ArsR family regulator